MREQRRRRAQGRPDHGGHPSREGVTVRGGTRRHPRIEAYAPTLLGHREVRSARQYRRIIAEQERRITAGLLRSAAEHARSSLTGLHMDKPTASAQFLDAVGDSLKWTGGGPLAETALNTGRAFVESGDVRRETWKGVRDLPAGLVMGAMGAVSDPGGTLKGMAEQYEHTYGPALKGDWGEYRRQLGEEHSGGIVQPVLDATILVGGADALLGAAARRGALGAGAKATMRAPRPRLRYSGGAEGVLEQEIPRGYLRAKRTRRRDASRKRTYERRYAGAGNEDYAPLLRPVSRPERRDGVLTGGEVVARGGLEVRAGGRGFVVPAPGRFRTDARLQRKQGAREKAQRRIVQLEEQHALQRVFANTVGRRVGKRIGNLSAGEQKAFRYVYGGLMAARDVPTALRHLAERRAQILDYRGELSAQGARKSLPGPRRKFNEELRVIDDLTARLEAGEPVLTDALEGAAKRMRRVEVAVARGRPDLEDVPLPGRVSQTTLRRIMPQAEFLSRMDQRTRAAARREGRAEPEGLLPPMRAGETAGTYVERVGLRGVMVRAQREGLLKPGYFPSERRFTTKYSNNAIGGSAGLVDDRTYTGELFRRGEEDTRPEVLLAGLMRGVKRRHNINLIAEQVEKHAIDLGLPERAVKAAATRKAKGELKRRNAAAEAAAREMGVSLKDLEAIGKSIARNHRRTQKHVRDVYSPNRQAMREHADDLSRRIGELNAAFTNPTEQHFFDELVGARNRLEERVQQAKTAGDIARWRELREDRDSMQQQISDVVDRRTRLFSESNRLNREREELVEELAALERGDRITGAPEGNAKEVTWYHGTRAAIRPGELKAPEPNVDGRYSSDLGLYLTSDPAYAGQYGGIKTGALHPTPPGRRLEVYVQPRKTLETRFGHAQPADMAEAVGALYERAQRATDLANGRLKPLADELRAVYDEIAARWQRAQADGLDERPRLHIGDPEFGPLVARKKALEEELNVSRTDTSMEPILDGRASASLPREFGVDEASLMRMRTMRDKLSNPDDPFTMAVSGRGPRRYDEAVGSMTRTADALDRWKDLDEGLMRQWPSQVREIEAQLTGERAPFYSQVVTKEVLQQLGFDSIRKVDVSADSLVVLDERILRSTPATERMDALMATEADLRTAHEGLRMVRESGAKDLLEDAIAKRDAAEEAFAKALDGGRAEVAERAGSRAVEAADARLAADAAPGVGRTIKELVDDLERTRRDPAEVMFFNPGRIYSEHAKSGVAEERFGFESFDQGDRGLLEAMNGNVLRGDELARLVKTRPEDFEKVTGWVALPKAVGEEILSSTRPEFLASRIWDIGKGKFSRVLLGLGNASWLAFQIGSNAFLSGLFGKVGPLDMYRAQKWWGGLTDDQRASLRPILGQSAHHMDFDRRYLGSAAANSTIVNTKRAFEKSAWWQQARRGNPIDLMFRMDAHQNLFFRRALLYSEAKRRMFDRMGESTHDIVRLQDRIEGTLTKSADRQLMEYLEDKPTLELHGRKVDELLGDYLTYTNAERRVLQRFVMFYGFVRHSTRLALWTLPTKHPITTAILGKLALLGADEARELLGGDQLPWGLGKFYFRGDSGLGRVLDAVPGIDVPDEPGVMEIDLARMSPATNAITDIRQANQIARVFPPMLSLIIGHIAEEDLNSGRDWQVRGMTRETLRRFSPLGSPYNFGDHIKILAGELSRTIPPARYAERVLFVGPQGDDASLIFGAAPTGYREDEIVQSIEEQRRRTLSRPAGQRVLDVAFPFLPRPSEDVRIVRNRAERQAEADAAREAFERRGHKPEGSQLERFQQTIEGSRGGGVSQREQLRRFRRTLRGAR